MNEIGSESDFRQGEADKLHRLLGPRTAFLIGSQRTDGTSHLCAASNVTNIGIRPQYMVVALSPKWETTDNIRRTGELTISLMDVDYIDDIWIVGGKYSKVELLDSDDKFTVGGLTRMRSVKVQPDGVNEALAVVECRVARIIDDLSDHVVFLAEGVYGQYNQRYFDSDMVIDVNRAHPVMQITGRYFAKADPCPAPDTTWCSELARRRRG